MEVYYQVSLELETKESLDMLVDNYYNDLDRANIEFDHLLISKKKNEILSLTRYTEDEYGKVVEMKTLRERGVR